MSRASRMAWSDSSFCGTSLGLAEATFAATFGLPPATVRRGLVAALGEDIDLVSLLHHLVLAQLQFPVGDALAGLHVVFHAVPGADEVHLGLREVETLRGHVGTQPLLDLGDGEALAGRAALVQAEIAVGVELAFVPEHPDLVLTGENDSAVAVLELRDFTDVLLGHAAPVSLGSFSWVYVPAGARAMFRLSQSAPVNHPVYYNALKVTSGQAMVRYPRTTWLRRRKSHAIQAILL